MQTKPTRGPGGMSSWAAMIMTFSSSMLVRRIPKLMQWVYAICHVPENVLIKLSLQTRPPTAIVSSENLMPRFWVLTDHARREVVLVIRGTMSLNELAVDLTCEPAPFELDPSIFAASRSRSRLRKAASEDMLRGGKDKDKMARDEGYSSWSEFEEELENIPGAFPVDFSTPAPAARREAGASTESLPSLPSDGPDEHEHMVHGGMLKMARAMGAPGKPVHVAVRHALRKNHGYCASPCFSVSSIALITLSCDSSDFLQR